MNIAVNINNATHRESDRMIGRRPSARDRHGLYSKVKQRRVICSRRASGL